MNLFDSSAIAPIVSNAHVVFFPFSTPWAAFFLFFFFSFPHPPCFAENAFFIDYFVIWCVPWIFELCSVEIKVSSDNSDLIIRGDVFILRDIQSEGRWNA